LLIIEILFLSVSLQPYKISFSFGKYKIASLIFKNINLKLELMFGEKVRENKYFNYEIYSPTLPYHLPIPFKSLQLPYNPPFTLNQK